MAYVKKHKPEKSASRSRAQSLCEVVRLFAGRKWCLATSGNFSIRIDSGNFLITQSGKDKSDLTPADLMSCNLEGIPENADLKPSAETALHRCLYQYDASIAAVFHTHSVTSTVLSRSAGDFIEISGYEMQKALAGTGSHEDRISLPVFENTQDLSALAERLRVYLEKTAGVAPGFLIRGHGLYAWGSNIPEARRHIEGLEFLMSCLWQEKFAGAK